MTDKSQPQDIPTTYDHAGAQDRIYQRWLEAEAFAAIPDNRDDRYVIMMPLPNVTGALHMGHAMDNVMQDLLIRWHRMMQDNTLWMPGTDHAGIATQAVVEKRLFELEGKTRHDIGREALVDRIWQWKDQYQARIIKQQQQMGCSCDWERQRFTMDAVCTAAVRETFYRMFKDGLIYRGNRLVNWDCQLQTAVSDDEIVYEMVTGNFWHLHYPIIDPKPGEPTHIEVATTRPETMLGDTAVACHPEPRKVLERQIEKFTERMANLSGKERTNLEAEVERLEERKKTHLAQLELIAEMARDGRKIMLPLQERVIPLILDEWAKPELGSGCVKVTPAHDPNDYDIWRRHVDEIDIINILNPDGTLNENAGAYRGMDRFEARRKVVADFDAQGLLKDVREHDVEIGHSDRSKTPIEPYLSKQWFVKMGDVDGGIVCGRGTDNEFKSPGLAQAAIDAVRGDWKSPTGRKLTFYPDPVRYGDTYVNWLTEKRDWCISRQLWWGHRIPIWKNTFSGADVEQVLDAISAMESDQDVIWVWTIDPDGNALSCDEARDRAKREPETELEILVCLRSPDTDDKFAEAMTQLNLVQDPDVLDTWFSSALWPHSTLGWPDPEHAPVEAGQRPLEGSDNRPDALSYYYPGSCLVTGRDIITLWVARMALTGLYNLGDLPFTDCFIHANILDGKGERMSKSKGNGIDPVDIIERYGADAMRYVLCDMQTGTQDIRLPVQAISPYTGEIVDLATAKHGRNVFTYICPVSGQEFDVLGTMEDIPAARVISDRFEIGKNFCNKLWNAARFALMNLQAQDFRALKPAELQAEDRWILARLTQTITGVTDELKAYNPSAAVGTARSFFWGEFCDWYLELIKPRMRNDDTAFMARQVLALVMDHVLRLFHPFIPFITEEIWQLLHERAPVRGLEEALPTPQLLVTAAWPTANVAWKNEGLEADFELMQDVIRGIRNVRSKYNVPPSKKLTAHIKAGETATEKLRAFRDHILNMATLSDLEVAPDVERPRLSAIQVVGDLEIYLEGVLDPEKERERLTNQQEKLLAQKVGTEKKLSNENFVNRAPAHVVEAERQKLKDIEQQLTTIEDNLKMLN